MVTGVLPIAIEDATKAVQTFLYSGKEYVCLMQLHSDIPEDEVKTKLNDFIGEIYQKPPIRASVKRELRKRIIYDIKLLEIDNRRVLFRVSCQAGTYIRKLCSDIGEALGSGAHMRELRRTRAGTFAEDKNCYTINELQEAKRIYKEDSCEEQLRTIIQPVEEAFGCIPKIYIRDSAVDAICHGASLAVPGVAKLETKIEPGNPVAIFTLKGEIIALAESKLSTEAVLDVEKGIVAKVKRVIMKTGTYPKEWKRKQTDYQKE